MTQPCPADRRDKSEEILEAASSVFLTHGFSAATTDMIQREARISKATLYAHFPGKELLFTAVIERECAAMTETMRNREPVSGDIACTLTDLGLSYLKTVLSPTGLSLFRVVVADAPRFPELGRRFYLAGPRVIFDMVAERLAEAAKAGEIDIQSVGLHTAAILFVSLLRGEAQMECLTHPEAAPSDEQRDRWARLAVNTFLAAFARKPLAQA